jgi:hypothetical protein
MTSRVGKTYPSIRRAGQQIDLDRGTWAGESLLILSYDTVGAGVIETELLDFGLVFEGPPFFSYGVELQPGHVLVANDFPLVTAGVKEWKITEVEADSQATPFYLGAFLWISIEANTAYHLRFRLSFEGITMRNVEYIRGLSG